MNPVKECDCRRIDDNFVFLRIIPELVIFSRDGELKRAFNVRRRVTSNTVKGPVGR